ncbi:hypothetical protein [Methylobacterium isbiliense]|jgi:hypothetical protein|uniref:Uncharacterized protein n=1 Tax=Methylobacterium isbiliense TaxID=315478 RepID=A0ABQ4SC59_9HYPH|nr:hypothetical protein [Methylobacterium isbiliense]MDN3627709.1 hypothetical protein [Methylobacterium isbiliense]GJD99967.1 hypothetical protein GMJLKIPL_1885 [Methylobacterium isbiliense]
MQRKTILVDTSMTVADFIEDLKKEQSQGDLVSIVNISFCSGGIVRGTVLGETDPEAVKNEIKHLLEMIDEYVNERQPISNDP